MNDMRKRANGNGKTSDSRPPSPTYTTFSGISNYRQTGSMRDAPPPLPNDTRAIARMHYDELCIYLQEYLARETFQELSTDVYDELLRRKGNERTVEVPFLPVRDEFHPKRNQARQKLATLPGSRFQDLSSDVYYELVRRYPEFADAIEPPSPGSEYDDVQSPEYPNSPPVPVPKTRTSANTYGRSSSERDRRQPSVSQSASSGNDPYGGVDEDGYAPSRASTASRRRPSQETYRQRPSEDRRRPSQDTTRSRGDEGSEGAGGQSATSGMIIPNKSTIAEEEIEVPYGREGEEEMVSPSTAGVRGQFNEGDDGVLSDEAMSPRTPQIGLNALSFGGGGLGGLSGLGERFRSDEEESPVDVRRDEGRRSKGLDRSRDRDGDREDDIRREYEERIKGMQMQIAGLEREVGDARDSQARNGDAKVRQLEDELERMRKRTEEQSTTMRALQRELDELREDRERDRQQAARRARDDEDELRILRDRCEQLEEERESGGGTADGQLVEQLQADMEGLVGELSDLSRRNDELMATKDSDMAVIQDLQSQVKEYKRKYESAKTELRSVKATSQLFSQGLPKTLEDQLPVSRDGGILDIHVTAFLSAIDALLNAGRSNAPTRVLTPMKAVVNAVTAIVDDVREFERRAPRDVDLDALRGLQERAEATLGNLVAASKTHAQSAGMAPVSLLDAAASHVAATVTEIGKTVCIRKASRAEQEQFGALRSVEERRAPSAGSSRRGEFASPTPSIDALMSPTRMFAATSPAERRGVRPPSASSSHASSPPPIFDQMPNTAGATSDDSGPMEGEASEDAWAELKPYLEAQTESIVYAIQSVLSGVRSPTPPPTLNENLTQIITIVSSIVAVCKDNIPAASAGAGNDILRELSDHANRLSEVHAMPELTKDGRQVMAKSSFAIANAMKGLMKLQ